MFTEDRTDGNYQLYKAQRNVCTSLRRKAMKGFFCKKATQSENLREFWKAYRPFLHSRNSKQANDIVIQENGTVFTDKKQIAEIFNEQFVHITDGVGEITDYHYGEGFYDHPSLKAIQANKGIKGDEDCLSFKLTNASQIEELLSKINTRKACGHDMLPQRFIRDSSRAIAGPIAKILNTSIAQSRPESISIPLETGTSNTLVQEG